MTTHRFVEDAPLLGVRRLDSGAVIAFSKCAKAGIQDYAGYELGHPERPIIRVLRPESAVFAPDSMRTYAHKPLTNNHPPAEVTPENWHDFAVGHIGEDIARDGSYIRVPMMFSDAKAIKDLENGKTGLSAGYTANMSLLDSPEMSEYGEYDAVMTGFNVNHLALVQTPRAGRQAHIGDTATPPPQTWGASPIATTDSQTLPAPTAGNPPAPTTREPTRMTLKTVKVRGLDIEANDAAAQAIDQLTSDLAAAVLANDALATAKATAVTAIEAKAVTDAEAAKVAHDAAIETLKGEHTSTVADKDKEIGAKDARIDELEKAAITPAMLDTMVIARTALLAKASMLAKDADFTGKSDAEVKAIAVDAVHGAGFSKDRPEAWVDGVFDAAKAPVGTGDAFRDAMLDRKPVADAARKDNGQSAFRAALANAHKANPRAA